MKGKSPYPKILTRIISIILWIFGGILILSISLMLLLLIPSVQEFVVDKATTFISEKTNMNARIGSVHIGIPKTIKLGDIYIEDLEKDTLLYCKNISISAGILPLIHQKFNVDYLRIEGLKGKVIKNGADSSFNFSPLIEAFSNKKPTNEAPPGKWSLGFNELEFKNINLRYADHIDSTNIDFQLGHLAITANNVDILNMIFDLDKIELGQTSLKLLIGDKNTKIKSESSEEEKTSIPIQVSLNELDVEDIAFDLGFTSGQLSIESFIKKANMEPSKIELTDQKIILQKFTAEGISTKFRINQEAIAEPANPTTFNSTTDSLDFTFGNFDWNFLVNHAELRDVNYQMDMDNLPRLTKGMDYMHMEYSDFNVVADSLYFNKNETGGIVSSFSVKEISGPEIKAIKGKFWMDNNGIYARDFDFKTNLSWIKGSATLSYPALRLIGTEIKKLGFDVNVSGKINPLESKPFTSFLDDYPLLKQVTAIEVQKISLTGILSDLTLHEAKIGIGNSTLLWANAHIAGLPSTDIDLSYSIDTLITNKNDLLALLPDTLLPLEIQLPQEIALKSKGKTDFKNGEVSGEIKMDFGEIILDASIEQDNLSAQVSASAFNIGAILNDSIVGKIYVTSQIDGRLNSNTLESFSAKANIDSVEFNRYTYRNAFLNLNWEKDIYSFTATLADTSVTAKADGKFTLLDSANKIDLNLELIKSNFKNLNITDEFFEASGLLNIDIEISSEEDYNGLIKLSNTDLATKEHTFHINEIAFEADINPTYTNFTLNSEILDAKMTGNTKISELNSALIDHLDHYITLPDSLVSEKDFVFEYNLELKNSDFITEFLIPDLKEIKVEKFYGKYIDKKDLLQTEIIIPKLVYKDMNFNDLSFNINSLQEYTTIDLKLESLVQEKSSIHNMALNSIYRPGFADINFTVRDLSDSLKYQFISHLTYKDSVYRIVIDPDSTIFNYEKWTIPQDNYLQLSNGNFSSSSTRISNGDQIFWLETKEKLLKMNFSKFQIYNFTNILEYDSTTHPPEGSLTGHVELDDPFNHIKINGDLNIPDLSYGGEALGELHAELVYNPSSLVKFDVKFQNEENLASVAGTMTTTTGKPQEIQIVMESDIKNAASFQPFLSDYTRDLKGALKGRLAISGDAENQKFSGNINLTNLNFVLLQPNTLLKNNGKLIIEDNLLKFDSFVIKDSLNNPFEIKGQVDFQDIQNPIYNLSINAVEFLAINTKPNKDLFVVGKLLLGIDMSIIGEQSNLTVNSNLSIKKGTNIKYIMPGNDLELITAEDIVQFVDFADPELEDQKKTGYQSLEDSIASFLEGIDFKSNIIIDPEAKFTVLVDPNSGDYTEFQIGGNLQYRYNDTQRGNLSGLIEFKNGFYELSFYGLVKKRFKYDPGSTVSWAGDLMEGKINFSARHTVRTNSVGLVSNEVSGAELSLYNQQLPYDVILKVEESIENPRISFFIDLSERYRSTYPSLDSKLNILNQESMESERNKQVFALLVGGTFITEGAGSSDGSSNSNFATTAARNSVNSILTQQLNKFTGQLIKGVDINLGVNTFEDYSTGSAQTRTQFDVKVSKQLLNNRLSAELESHIDLDHSAKGVSSQSNAGLMEFAVSYSITETGNYRIKAFSENAYDLFDGEIQNSGFAFIFVKEFEYFRKKKSQASNDALNQTGESDK